MNVCDLNGDALTIEVVQLTETIKRARAALMLHGTPTEAVVLHRKIGLEHELTEHCWCNPVLIVQNEWRPSLYFAHQVLYPVMH
jgi:hypothetical protein